jgi:hypothetical protein
MKRNRITVFVFFKPDEIIKNRFYSTSVTKKDEVRSFYFVIGFGNRVRYRNEVRVTQSFRHSVTQERYFHWHCPRSSYGNFCQVLNHSAWIVISNDLELVQLLSSIIDRKYFSYWNWKQECSLSLTNSNWYIRSHLKIIIYLHKFICERLPSVLSFGSFTDKVRRIAAEFNWLK